MRLWSIHPRYLDSKGLVAVWREALLAQKVLSGSTRGYRNHPQLMRFKETENGAAAIGAYLQYILDEAQARGFNFNAEKIDQYSWKGTIPVNEGQLEFEFRLLLKKLRSRDEKRYQDLLTVNRIEAHPLFAIRKAGIEMWEKGKRRNDRDTGEKHQKM